MATTANPPAVLTNEPDQAGLTDPNPRGMQDIPGRARAGTDGHLDNRRWRFMYCFQNRGGAANQEATPLMRERQVTSLPTLTKQRDWDLDTEDIVQELGLGLRTLSQKKLSPKGELAAKAMGEALKELESSLGARESNASTCTGGGASSTAESPRASAALSAALEHIQEVDEGPTAAAETKGEEVDEGPTAAAEAGEERDRFVSAGSIDALGAAHSIPALNELIMALWSRIETHVQNMIHNDIEPSINASLPGLMAKGGGVKFTKVSLGKSRPMLGPLSVDHNKETGDITLDMGVNVDIDLDVELTAMGIPVGITKFSLKGDLVILMKPPMAKPPFFGGLQVYFLNAPDIDIGFSGAARMANVPGLRGAVRGAIDSAVNGICVVPRRIAVDLNEDDEVDAVDLQYPEPLGVLGFQLWSGSNLVAADMNVFGKLTSSDPYVVASLGIQSWTSPHVSKNLNPTWGDGNGLTTDFLVHDDYQTLSLKVFDYDFGTSDDLIGVAAKAEIHTLVESEKPQAVDLLKSNGEAGGGSLSISAHFFSLSSTRPPPMEVVPHSRPSQAYLSVRLATIKGLQEGAAYPFKVSAQVLGPDQNGTESKQGSFLNRIGIGSQKLEAKGQVFAEACSQASHAKQPKELAEAYQAIAINLAEKGSSEIDIADVLEVGVPEVKHFLQHHKEEHDDLAHAKERQAKELERLSVKQPRFDEVLQLLLPWGPMSKGDYAVHEDNVVALTITDKNQKVLGTAKTSMKDLLEAPDFQIEGLFNTDATGIDVFGRLRLRWLVEKELRKDELNF